MNSKEYQKNALLTESNDFEKIYERLGSKEMMRLLHAGIGMTTESAEFVDMLKKHIFYGKPLDATNLFEEIGDLLWYCSIALNELGYDFEECMEVNNKKLMTRYNQKKFDEQNALQRNLQKELLALDLKTATKITKKEILKS